MNYLHLNFIAVCMKALTGIQLKKRTRESWVTCFEQGVVGSCDRNWWCVKVYWCLIFLRHLLLKVHIENLIGKKIWKIFINIVEKTCELHVLDFFGIFYKYSKIHFCAQLLHFSKDFDQTFTTALSSSYLVHIISVLQFKHFWWNYGPLFLFIKITECP